MVQRSGVSDSPGQNGTERAEWVQHLPPQMAVSTKHSQVIDKPATNHSEADVEILNLGSARIMEKQTGDKGNYDFENQLREIDAKIFGMANTRSWIRLTRKEQWRM